MNIQKIGDRTAELLNLYYNNEIEPFLTLVMRMFFG